MGRDLGLVALTVAAFLVSLDRAIFAPLLPAIARDLQATIAAAGLAVTAYTVPYGVCQLFYGPVADRAGKIAVVRWAVVVFALSTGVCALAPTLPVLQLLRVLAGGAAAAVIPLSLAYIGDAVPYDRRQQTIATLMGFTSLGAALSSAVGGLVGNFLSWRALFGFSGALGLLAAGLLFRAHGGAPARAVSSGAASAGSAPAGATPVGGSATSPASPRASAARSATPGTATGHRFGFDRYARVLALGKARTLYVLVGLEGVAVLGGFTYMGAYLRDRFALDYLTIGLVLAANGASTLAGSRVLRRLHGQLGEHRLMFLGGLLQGGGYLLLAPLSDWRPTVLPFLMMGVGFSFFHSTLQTRATELHPELRGTSVALFAFSLFIGGGIGTAALGWVAGELGYLTLLLICGVILLAITLAAISRR